MMLGKLRRRIVCVLMAVFLVLIVAVMLCMHAISNQQTVERQKEILRRAALQPMTSRSNTQRTAEYTGSTPFFAVRFDASGDVTSVYRYAFEISEEAAIRAAERALKGHRASGVLPDRQLRYLVRTDRGGVSRVTLISTEPDTLQQRRQLLSSLLLIPLLMALLLVLAALPLSAWLIRPVQRAWEQQKTFIADASHELKTPLTVILANLSILRRHRQQSIESCESWIESTQEEAEQMRRLVEDMLTLARTENEQSAWVYADVNLSDLCNRALMTFEPVAFDKGVTLESHIEDNLSAVCSETHIRQLMTILLDNAIKYAGGEKKVTVTLTQRHDGVELCVRNTGSPIPADALPHIFDRFYRESAHRPGDGFGLGLAIARQIVQAHRGEIRASSTADEGTTLVVRLPPSAHRRPARITKM